jgi:hypothetical protein
LLGRPWPPRHRSSLAGPHSASTGPCLCSSHPWHQLCSLSSSSSGRAPLPPHRDAPARPAATSPCCYARPAPLSSELDRCRALAVLRCHSLDLAPAAPSAAAHTLSSSSLFPWRPSPQRRARSCPLPCVWPSLLHLRSRSPSSIRRAPVPAPSSLAGVDLLAGGREFFPVREREHLCLDRRRSLAPYHARLFVVVTRSRDDLTAPTLILCPCRVPHVLCPRRVEPVKPHPPLLDLVFTLLVAAIASGILACLPTRHRTWVPCSAFTASASSFVYGRASAPSRHPALVLDKKPKRIVMPSSLLNRNRHVDTPILSIAILIYANSV